MVCLTPTPVIVSTSWLLITLTTTLAVNTPTQLYKRCSPQNESHSCLQYQNYQCTAKQIADIENVREQISDYDTCTDTCPTVPTDIEVQVYKEFRYTNRGAKIFTGANVTWTITSGGYQPRGFVAKFTSNKKESFTVYLNTTQATDVTVFSYDCFFPIIPDRKWTVAVYSVPYDSSSPDHFISAVLILDNNGTQVLPHVTTDESTTDTDRSARKPVSGALQPPPDNRNGIVVGVLFSVVFLSIASIVLCYVRKHWQNIKQGNCFKPDPSCADQISKTSTQSTDCESCVSKRRVSLVYLREESTPGDDILDLVTSLSEICHLIDISALTITTTGDSSGSLREMVLRELTDTHMILVISSEKLVHAVDHLRTNPANNTPVMHALDLLINTHHKYRPKIITAYFPLAKDKKILLGFCAWAPVALPNDIVALKSHIQDPETSPLVDRMHDFDDLDDEDDDRFDSGFSDTHNWDNSMSLTSTQPTRLQFEESNFQPQPAIYPYEQQIPQYPAQYQPPEPYPTNNDLPQNANVHGIKSIYNPPNQYQPQLPYPIYRSRAQNASFHGTKSQCHVKPPIRFPSDETLNVSECVADLNAGNFGSCNDVHCSNYVEHGTEHTHTVLWRPPENQHGTTSRV